MLAHASSVGLLQTPPSTRQFTHLHYGFWGWHVGSGLFSMLTSNWNRPTSLPKSSALRLPGIWHWVGHAGSCTSNRPPSLPPSQFTHLHYGFQGCDSGWDLLADVLSHSPLAAGRCRPSWSRWFPWWGWPVVAPPRASSCPGSAWGPRCAARRDDMLSSHASHETAAPEEKSSFIYYFICLNTCRVPHLEMSPWRFTMATIVLFPASENTHCALVVCDTEWVTAALHSAFWTAAKVVTVLPSWCKFCVHHTTMHQFTVSLYSKPHT